MPGLRVVADEQGEFQLTIQMVHEAGAPALGTNFRWRAVAALPRRARAVIAGETKSHRRDRKAIRVVELIFVDAEPLAEAVAGWIRERSA